MNAKLLALAFGPLAFGLSGFAFVGLIDPMAADLNESVAVIGQLQAAFFIACGIGGPFVARATGGFDRKRLLLWVIAGMAAMNAVSAIANSFEAIVFARLVGGVFAALTLPVASTIAVGLVDEAKRPKAIAIVLGGYTVAFLLGIPVATALGDWLGWRAAFWLASVSGMVALGITLLAVPSEGSAPSAISASFKAALVEQNPKLLLISLIGFTATFTTVSFIGPIITAVTSLEGAAIGAVQISTGVGSLLGLSAGAYLARFPLRYSLEVSMTVAAITQAAFSLGMFNDLGVLAIPSVIAIIIFGSGAMFATNPIVQTELARSSGPAATIAFALNSSMIYLGQGLGAVCGGLVIAFGSLSWTGFAGAVLAVFATMAVASIKRRPQGQSVRS